MTKEECRENICQSTNFRVHYLENLKFDTQLLSSDIDPTGTYATFKTKIIGTCDSDSCSLDFFCST
jgi:hypothetical protein